MGSDGGIVSVCGGEKDNRCGHVEEFLKSSMSGRAIG